MTLLFHSRYKELLVCSGFVFIVFAYPWLFQVYLINTNIISVDMAIPLMTSAILITITPFYYQLYKHILGYGLGEWRTDLFIIFLALIISVQFILFYYQSSSLQSYHQNINIILIANITAIVILAPVYEELIFRGVVYGYFKKNLMCSTITSAILTSLIFLSLHWYYDILSLVVLFIISLILAFARELSCGILLPVLLHSLMNGFVLFMRLH